MTTVPIFEANAKQDESQDGCLASPTTCVGRRVSNLALVSGKTRRKWLGTVKNYFQEQKKRKQTHTDKYIIKHTSCVCK